MQETAAKQAQALAIKLSRERHDAATDSNACAESGLAYAAV
jgi:hypothetical protein